jgi:outer membrane biosynthesis protein TonB
MAQADPETGWRGRLAEMEQQLHALAADLAQDVGEAAPLPLDDEPIGAPAPPSSSAAPPPPPPPPPSEPLPPPSEPPPPPSEPLPPAAAVRCATRPTESPAPAPEPAFNATLQAMCARLLASMRELMAGYELALTHVSAHPASESGPVLTLAAGPFDSVAVLQRFEDALRALPEVAEVAVRGYEGTDRALLEVQLHE